MRTSARGALIALALSATFGVTAAQAAPFVNGGFDDTPGNAFTPGWSPVNLGSLGSGGQAGAFVTFNSDTDALSQSFEATAGQYFMTFYLQTAGTAIARGLSVVLNGNPISGSPFEAPLGPNWFKFELTVTLGANNTLAFTGSGISEGQVGLDEISFRPVPGPLAGGGALSFLALGIAGLGYRLRRRMIPSA